MKTQKGITLIVLIITIIVLLILAVVAIKAVQGDSIIAYAQNATTAYNQAQVKEKDMLQTYLNVMDDTQNLINNATKPNNSVQVTHSGTIPEGGTYYVGATLSEPEDYTVSATAIYTAGDEFPEVQTGDIYIYGDYEYCYGYGYDAAGPYFDYANDGWGVHCIADREVISQFIININDQPITSLSFTFAGYGLLIDASNIIIPNTVTNMSCTFCGCNNLATAPIIPESVVDMESTFEYCPNLTGTITINTNPTKYDYCFGTEDIKTFKNLILTGSSTMLQELAETSGSGMRTIYDANGNILMQ